MHLSFCLFVFFFCFFLFLLLLLLLCLFLFFFLLFLCFFPFFFFSLLLFLFLFFFFFSSFLFLLFFLIRFPVRKSVSSVLSHILFSACFGSWHRFDELCGNPIIHNSLFSLCTQFTHVWFTAAFRLFISRLSGKRKSHHGSGAVLIVDSSIPGWLHVGTWALGWTSSGVVDTGILAANINGLTRPWNKLWLISSNS